MATTRHRPKVSYTTEEYEQVKAQAAQVKLNVSEFLRRLSLGHHVPDPFDFAVGDAMLELLNLRADLARSGNLLKLALDVGDEDLPIPTIARIENLVSEIRRTQDIIREKVMDLHLERHPKRRKA